jgi:hypothetical protein
MNQTLTTLGITETVSPPLRRFVRYTISDDAVLTLTDAAEILPGRSSTNRAWIEVYVEPIQSPSKRCLYRWGDIVAAMKEAM